MSQVVEFRVEGDAGAEVPISVSPRDAARIVEELRLNGAPDSVSAADDIERATKHHEEPTVRLGIGEDESVLGALVVLRETGDYLSRLAQLERALTSRIERDQ